MFDISLEQDLAAEPVYSEVEDLSLKNRLLVHPCTSNACQNKIFANTYLIKNSKFCTSKFEDKESAPILMIKNPFL